PRSDFAGRVTAEEDSEAAHASLVSFEREAELSRQTLSPRRIDRSIKDGALLAGGWRIADPGGGKTAPGQIGARPCRQSLDSRRIEQSHRRLRMLVEMDCRAGRRSRDGSRLPAGFGLGDQRHLTQRQPLQPDTYGGTLNRHRRGAG